MKLHPALTATLLAAAACSDPSAAREPVIQRACAALPLVSALAGRSIESLVAEHGRPQSDTRFRLADGIDPSRRVLLNVLERPRDDEVLVRELTWTTGGCQLTVWFRTLSGGRWRSVQALRTAAAAES